MAAQARGQHRIDPSEYNRDVSAPQHKFVAVAFVENFSLRELATHFPTGRRNPHQLAYALPKGGEVFLYPFGAVVFCDVPPHQREEELSRLRSVRPGLTMAQVYREEFSVREDAGAVPDVSGGVLTLDKLTLERSSVIALTVGQSAAMEYYERIVDEMFGRTDEVVDRLEKQGTVQLGTRSLHRFIGAAMGVRNEVVSILHLLDRPDAAWEDPGMDKIYGELRAEFDLVDRYQALEQKLRGVQDALELVLDVARDKRITLLELIIVALILMELVLSVWRH